MLDKVTAAGYAQYEISNFARTGFESRHNTKYWRLEPVYGFGVSAHSFDGSQRYANERDTAKYVSLIESGGSAETMREKIDAASEFVFLGLRLNGGVNLREYKQMSGGELDGRYGEDIERLIEDGLLELDADTLRLTKKGMLFSNEVFAVFV
jgi:oxygen-independent coproporphyrinogen-3 oxidase